MAIYNGTLADVTGFSNFLDVSALKSQSWVLNGVTPTFETTGFGESAVTMATGAPGGTITVTGLYPATPETGLTASVTHTGSGAGTDIDCYEFSYTVAQPLEEVTGFGDSAQAWYPVGPLAWSGSWSTRHSDGSGEGVELTTASNNTAGAALVLAPTDASNDSISANVMLSQAGVNAGYNQTGLTTYNFASTGAIAVGAGHALWADAGGNLALQTTADTFQAILKLVSGGTNNDIWLSGSAYFQTATMTATRDLITVSATWQITGAITSNHLGTLS